MCLTAGMIKASAFIMPRQEHFALLEFRRIEDGGTISGKLLIFLI